MPRPARRPRATSHVIAPVVIQTATLLHHHRLSLPQLVLRNFVRPTPGTFAGTYLARPAHPDFCFGALLFQLRALAVRLSRTLDLGLTGVLPAAAAACASSV